MTAQRQWLVPLTLEQINLLREGIDSERYHRSPQVLRNSGHVIDQDDSDDLFVDDDEGGTPWADYAAELDALDTLLATFAAADADKD